VSKKLRKRVLEALLKSQGFVSGAELARLLGVSRATVSRLVGELTEMGFVVEVRPGVGYRVEVLDDLRYAERVLATMRTRVRFSAHYLEKCSSSQDVAEALALQGASEGVVVVCEEMWGGRGRMGRRWSAGKGGLWFTVLLRPPRLKNLHILSLAAGLSVARALKVLFSVEARVKWPNDVLIGEKKVCGVLVEARAEADKIHHLLLGVGVNINNELPEELREAATSLRDVLGFNAPRAPLLREILLNIDSYYNTITSGDVDKVVKEWREWSLTIGRAVRVLTIDRVLEGVAIDIDGDGSLLIDTGEGVEKVMVGDVVHIRTFSREVQSKHIS
jgi:BirA family biotin operon repressor/biotin-[acetyl-CoA-carboxylase] ligase